MFKGCILKSFKRLEIWQIGQKHDIQFQCCKNCNFLSSLLVITGWYFYSLCIRLIEFLQLSGLVALILLSDSLSAIPHSGLLNYLWALFMWLLIFNNNILRDVTIFFLNLLFFTLGTFYKISWTALSIQGIIIYSHG